MARKSSKGSSQRNVRAAKPARRRTEAQPPRSTLQTSVEKHPCPIVGIGASAGGIDALHKFFSSAQAAAGLAYVVILHLDPEHSSSLPELMARFTRLDVQAIEDGMAVKPDHVYVIRPNTAVTMQGGLLRESKPLESRGQRTPIDGFLQSLAIDQAENAACVILSGTGSDGTIGLRAIKENGGLILAQSEAEYEGMMRSAVATGLVDFVLPADQMAPKLEGYFRHLADMGGQVPPEATDYIAQIYDHLRARTGHDFSGYKDKTILRRVQRRMQVLQVTEVADFVEQLAKDPVQIDLLFRDLLIGVTNFFRDPEAFAILERRVIPRLFEGKGPDDTIRIWVPACATGEEAYSIAILLREHMPKSHNAPKLQIFASDIDEHSLEVARLGRYPASIDKDVSPKRLDRYFMREDGTYRVIGDLREICLFSHHDLLRDAPFSKLDLISCRNLLIYLGGDLQDRVIPLFHYALRDHGFLFLGTSENVTRHSRLFGVVDKANRIFERRSLPMRTLPEFPLTTRGDRLPRRPLPATATGTSDPTLQSIAERVVLDRYAPAYAVVDADGEILQLSGRNGKYLELPAGVPNNNIFSMARRGLRLDLRAALHKAVRSGQPTSHRNLTIGTNGGRLTIDLYVHPVVQGGGGSEMFYLIAFHDRGDVVPARGDRADTHEEAENANLRHLEQELRSTKERLQATTEELESSNEELKSGNEELSSMNEELQSANEELETSKEELQSINEELQTVNAELNTRVEELGRANSDIANLLESTQIATVFLDQDLSVKSFTPAAKDLFHLVESDAGRPISHVRARFKLDTIQQDAERVLRTLGAVERQVESSDNRTHYMMRILPYRTVENVIRGVVITFTDVTRLAEAEARVNELSKALRERVDSLEVLLDTVPVGVFLLEGDQLTVNKHGAALLGESGPGLTLRSIPALRIFEGNRELPSIDHPLQHAMETGQPVNGVRVTLLRGDGTRVEVMISARPLFDENRKVRGAIASLANLSLR
jgi:two-component system CheB/CheR fusion protein